MENQNTHCLLHEKQEHTLSFSTWRYSTGPAHQVFDSALPPATTLKISRIATATATQKTGGIASQCQALAQEGAEQRPEQLAPTTKPQVKDSSACLWPKAPGKVFFV